jgi:hypothetical protein
MDTAMRSIQSAFQSISSPLLNGTPRLGSDAQNKLRGSDRYDDDGAVFEDLEGLIQAKEGAEGDDEEVVYKEGKRVRKVELRIGGMTVSPAERSWHLFDELM